jgi:hypothetical protein
MAQQIIISEAANGFVISREGGILEIVPSFRKLTARLRELLEKEDFPAYMGSMSKTLRLVEEDAGHQSNT